jgi:hypothetical protein
MRRLLIGLGLVVVLGGAAAFLLVDRATYLDDAVEKMGDDKAFSTSTRAGQTVADISVELRARGAQCREQNATKTRCDAVLSAAAFTAVTAVAMLDCTAPDVHEARLALEKYLRSVRSFVEDGERAAPKLPKVVTC